jgi:glycosyltransferase involved in cell wall biosynthesis
MKISATIITLNEESNIEDCLESLDFADEIVVVDSGSRDRTGEICRAHPKVRFHERFWPGYGSQKNIAAELAANDWILNIDADERISPELKKSILKADFTKYDGFRFARKNYFGKRWIRNCGWYPDCNLRLYNKFRCSFNERKVHEAVATDGAVQQLSGDLVHYTYQDITDYLQRMQKYSSLAAQEIVAKKKKVAVGHILFRPVWTFFRMFILKKGFLEGYAGFLLSILYSFYTFSKYTKAKEIQTAQINETSLYQKKVLDTRGR